MFSKLQAKLKGFKHRSVPWLIANWRNKPVKQITSQEHDSFNRRSDQYIQELEKLFIHFSTCAQSSESLQVTSNDGFSIHKRKSSLPNAGNGVFVEHGVVKKGSIAALYPGTVYYPGEPLFFQSLGNSFILRCVDSIYIDGNDKGISARIFKSAAGRDMIGSYRSCDVSWLTDERKNPIAIGQYVNNATAAFPANVTYQELDIPHTFPLDLLQFIPNVLFSGADLRSRSEEKDVFMRTVLLIALRDIHEKEELFSSYFTEVTV